MGNVGVAGQIPHGVSDVCHGTFASQTRQLKYYWCIEEMFYFKLSCFEYFFLLSYVNVVKATYVE